MPDWEIIEERGARWANIISVLPGSYCAYVIWDQRHSGTVINPGLLVALGVFLLCIAIGAILNVIRRGKEPGSVEAKKQKQDDRTAEIQEVKTRANGVDLQGQILELYFHKWGDVISFPTRTTILLKVRVVNRGTVEATILGCGGLDVQVGKDSFHCDLVPSVPDSWRIRRRNDRVLNITYIEDAIGDMLGANPDQETYRSNIPRTGWLAFEYDSFENIEFPNAQLAVHFKDSLGEDHVIRREPMVYLKRGCIVEEPRYTRKQVDAMTSDELRHKLETEPGFAALVAHYTETKTAQRTDG